MVHNVMGLFGILWTDQVGKKRCYKMECIAHRIFTTAGGSDRQSSAATFLCVLSLIAYHKKWKVILTNFQEWNEIGICVYLCAWVNAPAYVCWTNISAFGIRWNPSSHTTYIIVLQHSLPNIKRLTFNNKTTVTFLAASIKSWFTAIVTIAFFCIPMSNHSFLICMPISIVIKYSITLPDTLSVRPSVCLTVTRTYRAQPVLYLSVKHTQKSLSIWNLFFLSNSLHILTRNNSLSIFSLPLPRLIRFRFRSWVFFLLSSILTRNIFFSHSHACLFVYYCYMYITMCYILFIHRIFASQTTLSSYKLLYYFHV